MDLSEAIKVIQSTAQQAVQADGKCKVLALPGEPAHRYATVNPLGELEFHETEPAPRHHHLAGLVEAIAYANDKGDSEKSVVWYDVTGVVVILDDTTRRDAAFVKFNFSPQFARLQKIVEDEETFRQAEFRRLLKVDFHDCTPNNKLLDWVSHCEWSGKSHAVGVLTKDRSSFGKSIENEAASKDQGDCPDELVLTMPVFDDPHLQDCRRILCDVELLHADQQFELIPYPGEMKRAIDAELTNIETLLGGDKGIQCPVFKGRP